jgi:Txe/YoeB family toxin of Txe-Axe toxin-antitoxin module
MPRKILKKPVPVKKASSPNTAVILAKLERLDKEYSKCFSRLIRAVNRLQKNRKATARYRKQLGQAV